MAANELLEALVQNSGLPEQFVRERLEFLMKQGGLNAETLNIDQVRDMVSNLLLDMINETLTLQA